MSEEKKNTDFSIEPKGYKIDGLPDYILGIDDDTYKVKMKDGKYYIIREIVFGEIKQIMDRSRTGEGKLKDEYLLEGLFKKTIIYPKMDDDSINKIKASHFFKLQKAFNIIFDIDDFL